MAEIGAMRMLRQLTGDVSMSAILAGIVSTLISFAGPLVIVFQAAENLPAPLVVSWVWAIAFGSGLLCVVLSLRYRVPVIIAWSIPGSVLLLTQLQEIDYAVAIGAYLVAALVVLVIGLSGSFDRIVAKLPPAITAAMLAGILFGFAAKCVTRYWRCWWPGSGWRCSADRFPLRCRRCS
jgi:benzoate membrane transport protein